jgi:hypothetical protein
MSDNDEHHLDQFLGERVGDATREDVRTAIRDHMGEVVIQAELPGWPDGIIHMQGWCYPADCNPATWDDDDTFVVLPHGVDAQIWQLDPEFRKRLGKPDIQSPPIFALPPDSDGVTIEQYLGGYRWRLPGGAAVAVVLWHGIQHVTDSGDVAPGMGSFTAEVTSADDE